MGICLWVGKVVLICGYCNSAKLLSQIAANTVSKNGSAQEFVATRILGCFLNNDEFDLCDGHAPSLEQQIGESARLGAGNPQFRDVVNEFQ
jgi:hypothetical protein